MKFITYPKIFTNFVFRNYLLIKYHNERALYQADYIGVDAIAYNAAMPVNLPKWIKNRGRECFARVKLFIDIARGLKPAYNHPN